MKKKEKKNLYIKGRDNDRIVIGVECTEATEFRGS